MVQEVDGLSRTHYCFLKRNASMLDTAMAGDSNQDLVCSLMFHSLQNGISWSLRNWSYSVTASLKRRKWSTDWRDSLSLSLFSSPSCRQASCVSFYVCICIRMLALWLCMLAWPCHFLLMLKSCLADRMSAAAVASHCTWMRTMLALACWQRSFWCTCSVGHWCSLPSSALPSCGHTSAGRNSWITSPSSTGWVWRACRLC